MRVFGGYFGSCPNCAHHDGHFNIRKNHWFFCNECKTCWLAGWNLLDDWRSETEETWEANQRRLENYREVVPVQLQFDPVSLGAEDVFGGRK
jgi:hypothetical protein